MVAAAAKINNSKSPTRGSAAAPRKKKDKPETFEKVSQILQNFVVGPVSGFSALTGGLSYLMPKFGSSEIAWTKPASFYSAKGAIWVNAGFGFVENVKSGDIVGTAGYFSDFVTTTLADQFNMYTLRALGSALDQWCLAMKLLAKHPEIKKKFNPKNKDDYDFNKYSDFADSGRKSFEGVKVIVSDIVKDFRKANKKKGFISAVLSVFDRAEKNILVSSAGLLASFGIALVPMFHKIGSEFRDVFGLHADFAVGHAGLAGKKGLARVFSVLSSAFYFGGTGADLIYRVSEEENLNLFAVGLDRFGAFFLSAANAVINRESRNGNNHDILKFNQNKHTSRKSEKLRIAS